MTIALKLAALCAGAAVVCLGGELARADSTPTTPTTPTAAATAGTWQKHEYNFAYMGFTTTYSCDGLADKLRVLLTAAGARSDSKARSGACAEGFGRPDKFARATLTFYTLAPAEAAAASDAAGAATLGTWRTVTLGAYRPSALRVGDCELVEQFRHNVLPMFTTQNVVDRTTCIPNQESGSVIDLKFDTFSAPSAPPAGGKPG